MSKKHRKPILPAAAGRLPPVAGPAALLRDAAHHLRRGNYAAAQELVTRSMRSTLSPELQVAARKMLAEAHFRAAVTSGEPNERLSHLAAALEQTPDAAKLRFHRGLVLWQLGRAADALVDLDAVAVHEPDRRGLAYLRALVRCAAGQPWDAAGLNPAEANTLQLVARLTQRKIRAGTITFGPPLLGKGTELWQALIAMRQDDAAAPVSQLKVALEQNPRKPVGRILSYYRGVAAARAGDFATARDAWLYAQGAGMASLALIENVTALLRGELVGLAQEGRWQEAANLLNRFPNAGLDTVVAETGSLAYFHLGYEAARAGKWPIAAQHWRKASDLAPNRYLAQNLALAEEALQNWGGAADAWRDMVRRRPRKEDHPDYLTDAQVAALWRHAAECYEHTEFQAEVETCLRNAIKYAPDDRALRMKLADILLGQGRTDAAETQLTDVTQRQPQNTDALVRLGRLYGERWDRDALPIWRQVLAVDPAHVEARDAVAEIYAAVVDGLSSIVSYRFALAHPGKDHIGILQIGLQELPGHPRLLAALGTAYARARQNAPARDFLLQAHRAAPRDVRIANTVLHELLHADGGDAIRSLIPEVHQIPGLLPAFWFDQASMAMRCKFGEEWASFFIDEALKLVGRPWVDDTRAGLLTQAFEMAHAAAAAALCIALEKRIREEVPASGALQYIEAHRLHLDKQDVRGAARLLKEAIRAARKANDTGVLRRAEAVEPLLRGLPPCLDIERMMRDLFPLD